MITSSFSGNSAQAPAGYDDPRFIDMTDPLTGIVKIGFREYPDFSYSADELQEILTGKTNSYMDLVTLRDAHDAIKAFIRNQKPSVASAPVNAL